MSKYMVATSSCGDQMAICIIRHDSIGVSTVVFSEIVGQGDFVGTFDGLDVVDDVVDACARVAQGRARSLSKSEMYTAASEANKCRLAILTRGREFFEKGIGK